jgi:phosphohistidine phosphatase
MELYLVQHAEAMPKEANPERPLTEQGHNTATDVATMAGRLGIAVQQIRHSGKTRAAQTATILAETLSPPGGVVQKDGLAPRDDVKPVADELKRSDLPVMLIGHLPFLERLAGYLLTGDEGCAVVQFCNAGIVCLVRNGEQWQVRWIITPEIAAL